MAEGLRPHHHQEFEYRTIQYFDKKRHYNHKKHCVIKKVTYKCMMCDYMTHEVYECYEPPPKSKTKALERNKKKYSNRG